MCLLRSFRPTIHFQNMKGLVDFSNLKSTPYLEEVELIQGNKQNPEQLLPVLENRNVIFDVIK